MVAAAGDCDVLLFQESAPVAAAGLGYAAWLEEASRAVAPQGLQADPAGDCSVMIHARWLPYVRGQGPGSGMAWMVVDPPLPGRHRPWCFVSARLPTSWTTDAEWLPRLDELSVDLASLSHWCADCYVGVDTNLDRLVTDPSAASVPRREHVEQLFDRHGLVPAPPSAWMHERRHLIHGTWRYRVLDLFSGRRDRPRTTVGSRSWIPYMSEATIDRWER